MFQLTPTFKSAPQALIQSLDSGDYNYPWRTHQAVVHEIEKECAAANPIFEVTRKAQHEQKLAKFKASATVQTYNGKQVLKAANQGLEWPVEFGYAKELKLEIHINLGYGAVANAISTDEPYTTSLTLNTLASNIEEAFKTSLPRDSIQVNTDDLSCLHLVTVNVLESEPDDWFRAECQTNSIVNEIQSILDTNTDGKVGFLIQPPKYLKLDIDLGVDNVKNECTI